MLLIFSVALIINSVSSSDCRFAHKYNISDILNNGEMRENFLNEYLEWEQKFINTPNVSVHPILSTTLDGQNLDFKNGTVITNHVGSAASKEAIHFMYLAQFINDSKTTDLSTTFTMIDNKMNAFNKFNEMYPGFGGFIPWFTIQEKNNNYYITPSNGWSDKTPALDNGEMYWGLYSLKWCILQNYNMITTNNAKININKTLQLISKQLNLMESNAKLMFYGGNGTIRWSAMIGNTSLSPTDPKQSYSGGSRGGDPYEGELFQWLLDLKSNWNKNENPDDIWTAALPHLHAINYTFSENSIVSTILVQEGWHFSSHEQWKLLSMPYLDNNLIYVIFENCEKVRTLNSDYGLNGNIGAIAGMYADVASPVANASDHEPYVSAGIPSISTTQNTAQYRFDVITPYSTMTTWLFNQSISAVWLLNMMKGPAMQNIYGTTKSILVNGTEICPAIGWDAKITTYVGVKGGTAEWTRYGLKNEALYDRFINVMSQQYTKVFGDDVNQIRSNHHYGIPIVSIPTKYINDFTTCN